MDLEKIKYELMEASEGLQMLSETDATFEFYHHEKPEDKFGEDIVVEWDGKPGGTKIEVLSLDEFFKNMTEAHAGATEEQKQNTERFKKLQAKLEELLEDVKAYKLSDLIMPVYLIGRTESGDYAGLKTIVVES
jgi:hypothetical protein